MLDYKERAIEPGITVFELKGRMHLGNRLSDAEWAARQLISGGHRKLILDMTHVEYIDSAALGMLVLTTGLMVKEGGRTIVAGANQKVLEIIKTAHTDMVLSLSPDVESAVKFLS